MSGIGALWGFIKSKLGSAAFLDVGTGAGDVVQLNGSAQLPAVDGSLLTGFGTMAAVNSPAPVANGGTGATDASTARTNLGLGTAATKAFGTGANQLVELDASSKLPAVDGSQLTNLPGGGIWTIVASEAELIAALAAQDPMIYVGADITATQDYAVTEDTEIRTGARCTLNMGGSYGFVVTAGYHFIKSGDGRDVSALNWNTSGAAHDLVQLGSGATAKIKDIHITESAVSANAGVVWTTGAQCTLKSLRFNFANNSTNRFPSALGPSGSALEWSDIEFNGGGSSCYGKVSSSGSFLFGSVSNIKFGGTWSAASFSMTLYSSADIDGISFLDANSSAYLYCRSVSKVTANGANAVSTSANRVVNVETAGTLTIGAANCSVSDCIVTTLTISQDAALINNSKMGALTAMTRDGCGFTNCYIQNGATINSGADKNRFVGCSTGNIASSGGATTITIASGANDTTVANCYTDAAISDSGTGSNLVGNVVY